MTLFCTQGVDFCFLKLGGGNHPCGFPPLAVPAAKPGRDAVGWDWNLAPLQSFTNSVQI